MILDKLFKFPILQIDGDEEERKEELAKSLSMEKGEYELIPGEAMCPYYELVAIMDKWVPTEESKEKARDGVYEHCMVTFSSSGSYIVPWKKEKFLKNMEKFIESLPKEPNPFEMIVRND